MLRRLAKAPFGQQIQQVIWDILMARQLCSAPVQYRIGNIRSDLISLWCLKTQRTCAGSAL